MMKTHTHYSIQSNDVKQKEHTNSNSNNIIIIAMWAHMIHKKIESTR